MAKNKILIVEDDPIIAQDIKGILESQGMEVCGNLQSGEAALSFAGQSKPDLILMDIRLEGEMDGIETAQRIWQDLRIPSVYLTAHSDEKTLQSAKKSYPLAFLVKPFSERELYIAIEIALNQRMFPALFEILGSSGYHELRKALIKQNDSELLMPEKTDLAPETRIFFRADSVKIALFKPALGDLTLDVLDVLCALWLQQGEATSQIEVSVDEILRFRGLQQQKSGSGRRGGYENKWRKQIALQFDILAHIWLAEPEKPPQPLLSNKQISTSLNWLFKPGEYLNKELFSPSPKTVLLSEKALHYNPYSQIWEKRMLRFLAYYWRENIHENHDAFSVQEILNELNVQCDIRRPLRTKVRFEKMLNTLMKDRVIERWAYQGKNIITVKKQWFKDWCGQRVQIDTPLNIIEQYSGLRIHSPQLRPSGQISFAFIKQIRRERALSLMDAAAEIGITHARLSQIERGAHPGPKTLIKIKKWILDQI